MPHYTNFLARNKHNTPVIIKYSFWRMTAENSKAVYACVNLGKEHVDERTIRVLSRRLNEDEKAALLAEGAEATDWIYTVIKEICKGEKYQKLQKSFL